ncbi:hypothetical protein [Halarcobacter sp.]|uniref:hypothetical protein n=1 Tax=Halarcobacter sp. TaxID=2321133 RepID=UPI002AA64457|nr:hypothetical protein [Halarcobacter sp.]
MIYKNEEFKITDEIIDIGYMAEDVDVEDVKDQELTIKKASPERTIQIFLSYPDFEDFKEEIIFFDDFINDSKVEINTYLFFNKKIELPKLKKLIPVFDVNNEFGEMYGTKIVSGSMENKLTKALFIIGKDGAIYHIDIPQDLEKPLDIERVRVELNKVYQSYTGVGCHG